MSYKLRSIFYFAIVISLLACVTNQKTTGSSSGNEKTNIAERHIKVYVAPYYKSAKEITEKPYVNVSKVHNNLLSSTNVNDILAVEESIIKNPEMITPMTLMVLSIRMYDVGQRDKSVFWFYAAKNRYFTLSGVLNMSDPSLSQVKQSISAFASLAGPYINSYAFCNIEKQRLAQDKALEWVVKNPYKVIFMTQLPAKDGDRTVNLNKSISSIRTNIQKSEEYFNDPKTMAEFTKKREEKGVNEKFCW